MAESYDVFLSHRSLDLDWVETLARNLGQRYRVFLDRWEIVPGALVSEGVAMGLRAWHAAVPSVASSSTMNSVLRKRVSEDSGEERLSFNPISRPGTVTWLSLNQVFRADEKGRLSFKHVSEAGREGQSSLDRDSEASQERRSTLDGRLGHRYSHG